MSDAVRVGLVIVGWLIVSFILMNFIAKREARQQESAARDPDLEERRARQIATSIGTFVIWLLTAASGLIALIAGLGLFVGMIAGIISAALALYFAGCFACAATIYLWSARILESLV